MWIAQHLHLAVVLLPILLFAVLHSNNYSVQVLDVSWGVTHVVCNERSIIYASYV
jgi:hypothetical protein